MDLCPMVDCFFTGAELLKLQKHEMMKERNDQRSLKFSSEWTAENRKCCSILNSFLLQLYGTLNGNMLCNINGCDIATTTGCLQPVFPVLLAQIMQTNNIFCLFDSSFTATVYSLCTILEVEMLKLQKEWRYFKRIESKTEMRWS